MFLSSFKLFLVAEAIYTHLQEETVMFFQERQANRTSLHNFINALLTRPSSEDTQWDLPKGGFIQQLHEKRQIFEQLYSQVEPEISLF